MAKTKKVTAKARPKRKAPRINPPRTATWNLSAATAGLSVLAYFYDYAGYAWGIAIVGLVAMLLATRLPKA